MFPCNSEKAVGMLRVVVVLLAQAVLVYGHFFGHNIFTVLLFAGLLPGFLVLLYQNSKFRDRRIRALLETKIQQRNAERRSGQWVNFEGSGEEYLDKTHPYSGDLNLFGEASLFQYVNDTSTHYGKEILKILFLSDKRDTDTVLRRQAAIKELSANSQFCRALKIEGMISEDISQSPKEMVDFFEGSNKLFEKLSVKYLARLFPALTGLLLAFNLIAGLNNMLLILFVLSVFVQVLVYASLSAKTENVLKEMSKFKTGLDSFGTMAALIKKTVFTAELNLTWQNKLPDKWDLKKISRALNVRNLTVLDLALNILFLWDIHCVCTLENIRAKGAKNMRTWLEAIGYFEAMSSMAVLPQQNPNWAYLEPGEELAIQAKNLGHPLIEEYDRVTNDFELKGIAIISGSNMSGKTTFMRTIGINLVLGYMGAPVCANKFKAPFVDIWTCMRPPDNLKQNISTFYAELLRIRDIINTTKPMLFLIDEIFAGTNSEDRVEGAKHVLITLQKKRNLGLITTHDIEVCKLEGFENYHFREYYENTEICFDYKIKPGESRTRNAKYLMRMIGIEIGL